MKTISKEKAGNFIKINEDKIFQLENRIKFSNNTFEIIKLKNEQVRLKKYVNELYFYI